MSASAAVREGGEGDEWTRRWCCMDCDDGSGRVLEAASAAMGKGVGGSLKSCPKGNARPDLVARTVMNLVLVAKMACSS